jgi:hypothetical protein
MSYNTQSLASFWVTGWVVELELESSQPTSPTVFDSAATATDCEGTYPTDVQDNSDCDDSDSTIYPNAEETRADGIDQDCDGGDVIWEKVVIGSSEAACALDSDGAIYCWGNNSDVVGNGPSDEGYIDIGVGDDHACAIAADGYVDCWGDDTYNQSYPPNLRFSSVSLHGDYSCGIRTSGQIYCWGHDGNYDVVDYAPTGTFATLHTSTYYACGQYINGAINCWGSPSGSYSELVSDVPSGSFDTISIGTRAACALNSNGVTSCWGNQSSIIDNVPSSSFGPYYELSVGEYNACVTDSLGAAYCWGATSSIANEPTSSLSGIDMGGYSGTSTSDVACGITGNGEIVCWGATGYLGTSP